MAQTETAQDPNGSDRNGQTESARPNRPDRKVVYPSILVFQAFELTIFGRLSFPGTRWYVVTVGDLQMVRDQKKFGNHCYTASVAA